MSSRDRVTIDLRGIGDAVRADAAARGQTVAAFVRTALVAGARATPLAIERLEAPVLRGLMTKLHLRMNAREAELLVTNARCLGLSYGEYVGRLVTATPLPAPVAERAADRAALRVSSDNLAALAGDINSVIRLVRQGKSEAAEKFSERMRGLEGDVRRHIDLVSRLVAGMEDKR
jgi:hypothetical protein